MSGASSWWDGHDRAPLRIGVCVMVALQWLLETTQLAAQSRDLAHYRSGGVLAQTMVRIPGAAWLLLALACVGLVAIARDRRPVQWGVWTLAVLALASAWQTQVFGSPSRNAFFPGAALLGWTLGQAWASEHGPQPRAVRERFAEWGALACIAAAYVGSCASKLIATLGGWASGTQVRALVVRQQAVADWSWLLELRTAIVESPALGSAAAIATLVVEGGGVLLLFGPRLRTAWALAIIGLHTAILLLCTMPYLEPMLLLGLLAMPWPQLLRRRHGVTPTPDRLPWPARTLSVMLVGVVLAWWLAPLGWRG